MFKKLMLSVQFPAARNEGRLLPLLPSSTIAYAAIPNYGDTLSQTLKIFRQELKESQVLRDWWGHGQMATSGPKVEDALDKICQLHQCLGDEIVVSVAMEGKEPTFLIFSEIHKPGLRQFVEQTTEDKSGKSNADVHVMDVHELATAKEKVPPGNLFVLARPDFVIVSENLAEIRNLNARIDGHSGEFASTAFGQRMAREYQGGVTTLVGADLHNIIEKSSPAAKQSATFQHSGFAEMQYLVWDHKAVAGTQVSQMELSFNAPRHGAASWLAKPTSLGSLDFVSPKAMMVGTLVLANPARIFDEAEELASLSNSNSVAAVLQAEQTRKISLKDDLLSLLGGEITVEVDTKTSAQAAWKAFLAVKDTSHLQQTLDTLVAGAHLEASQVDNRGVTYHTLQVPSGKGAIEMTYAFVDGYMVIGSSQDAAIEAVQFHRSGGSLAKSQKFLAALPPGHSVEASGMLCENSIAMTALRLRTILPELGKSLEQYSGEATPSIIGVYGEESAIREVSTNSAFDLGGALIVAAVAIPNLLRSKIAANESSAVGSVRTINTAQVMYASTYPNKGYAPNLASLGPDPRGPNAGSPEHAAMIDESLANESCRAEGWCTKSGFKFQVKAICKDKVCEDYVVIATPVSYSTGTRSFCSASDGVIRLHVGDPLTEAPSAAECTIWTALQ